MKKMLLLTLTATLLALGPVLSAAETPAQKAQESPKKAAGMPFRGKITAFDKTAQTLSLAGKSGPRAFQVTPETKIKRNGVAATVDDIVVGEVAAGYALRNGDGPPAIVTLNLGEKLKSQKPEGEENGEK